MTHTLLTRREAAARARISLRSLDSQLQGASGPPVIRLGGRVLIREADFNDWINGLVSHPHSAT